MKKISISIFSILFALVLTSTKLSAGSIGLGVSGSYMSIEADGKETSDTTGSETDTSTNTKAVDNNVIIAGIYAEYVLDNGFAIGIESVPGSADVNSSTLSRTDATSDSNESNQQDGTYKANAEIENHYTYYVELHSEMGLYGKLGMAKVDIKTNDEDAGTASTYPDVELDATTYGIGYKGSFGDNGYFKIEGSITDYDSFSVTSGSTNTVKGDLDTTQAKFAIGYNF